MEGPKAPGRCVLWLYSGGNVSIFVIDSYLNDKAFTAVKMDAKFYARYVKGVPFVN